MMTRFCRYVDKCFHLQELLPTLTDSRPKPHLSSAAVFASVFALFATHRTSLNSLEKDLVRAGGMFCQVLDSFCHRTRQEPLTEVA